MNISTRARAKAAAAFVAVAAIVLGVAGQASAVGPYWKTVGDTGVRCTNVGAQVYQSSYALSGTQMMQVPGGATEVRREVNGDAAGTFKVFYRRHTWSKADKYRVCNRLHTTGANSYYYTYAEVHYLAAPVTKCLAVVGVHLMGLPSITGYSWTGATYGGHVATNPC